MMSPGPGFFGRHAVERVGEIQLGDLDALDRAVDAAPRDLVALAHLAVPHAAQREPTEVRRRVEVRHERLERVTFFVLGRGNALEDELAQRLEVAALDVGVGRRPTRARVRVEDRELDLVLVGAEIDEELVHLVDDLGDARVGSVDLVDDEDHGKVRFERLAQHETRLRERAFTRVDEQQHTVDHRERALDLSAEVGVTGRVDDVEDHVAVANRRVLGENRDALLALEVVRVHDPLVDVLVGAERAGLPQERVDQRGLAVVDVGDDRNIAQIRARGHEGLRGEASMLCRTLTETGLRRCRRCDSPAYRERLSGQRAGRSRTGRSSGSRRRWPIVTFFTGSARTVGHERERDRRRAVRAEVETVDRAVVVERKVIDVMVGRHVQRVAAFEPDRRHADEATRRSRAGR